MTDYKPGCYRYVVVRRDDNEAVYAAFINGLADSEALHMLLCEIDPGENYYARFTTVYVRQYFPKSWEVYDLSKNEATRD